MRKLGVGRKERKGRKGQATPKARVKRPPTHFLKSPLMLSLVSSVGDGGKQRW